jgi:hypothetical protein
MTRTEGEVNIMLVIEAPWLVNGGHGASLYAKEWVSRNVGESQSLSRLARIVQSQATHTGHKPHVCAHPGCSYATVSSGHLKVRYFLDKNRRRD